ncbi:tyrosine-type recombinase/integrase [Bremerella sp. JC770]|uniref:tyrosine-type recombinase/integrase n=1 Tax=Bremerella sp. JC770 TaxID=3232137 RepID=UPI003459BF0E
MARKVWISRQWADGVSRTGRPKLKTQVVARQKDVRADDAILVFWKLPSGTNRSQKMEAAGVLGYKQALNAAEAKEKELYAQYDVELDPSKTAWSEFRKRFEEDRLKEAGPEKKATITLSDYHSTLNRIEEIVEPRYIEDLTDEAIDRFRAELLTRPSKSAKSGTLSAGAVNKILRYTKSILSYARKKKFNVAGEIEMVRSAPADTRYIPDSDLERIFKVLGTVSRPILKDAPYELKDWWAAALWLQRSCGLRIGEILDLKWQWVSLDQKTLILPTQKNKAFTTLPMGDRAVALLRAIQDYGENVFPLGQSHRKTIYDEFYALQRRAGVERQCLNAIRDEGHVCTDACKRWSFHALRKSFGFHNAKAGMPVQTLSALMRHSTIQVTMQFYVDQESLRLDAAGSIAEPTFQVESSSK